MCSTLFAPPLNSVGKQFKATVRLYGGLVPFRFSICTRKKKLDHRDFRKSKNIILAAELHNAKRDLTVIS